MSKPNLQLSGCMLRLSLAFLLAALTGCQSPQAHREKKQLESSEVVVPTKVQGAVMRFADQFSGVMAQGLDELAEQVGTPKARADAGFRKANQATAAITVASGPSPMANLLDMVVLVTTARIAQENYWVAKAYGEKARPLLVRLQTQETDVWNLATNYLSAGQLHELRELIAAWQKKYPEQHYTGFQNFTQFASMLGIDTEQSGKQKGSIFSLLHVDPLAGLDPAVRQIEQTRLLAERALYYGQRLPILLQWRGESMLYDINATPEMQQMLSMSERWTKTVEQLPTLAQEERKAAINQFFEGVANERTNIINNLMAQENRTTNLLAGLQGTLETGTKTSTNLNDLVKSAATLLQQYQQAKEKSAASNKRPFDILEYGTAISNAGITATQLNQLINSGDQGLNKVEQTSRQLATHIFVLALLFLLAIVIAMLLYRFLARALFGPKRTSGPA